MSWSKQIEEFKQSMRAYVAQKLVEFDAMSPEDQEKHLRKIFNEVYTPEQMRMLGVEDYYDQTYRE